MGNENKVKQTTLIKARFLPEEIPNTEDSAVTYNLEHEFEKTGKNSSFIFWLVLGSFLALLVAIPLFIARYLERKIDAGTITSLEQENLRIKDLLDESRNLEKRRDKIQSRMTELDKEHAAAVATLKENFRVSAQSLSGVQKTEREQKYTTDLSAENASYDSEMGKLRKELAEVNEQIERQRIRVDRRASNIDAIADNARKLNELQLKKQAEKYEAKIQKIILLYNPLISEPEIRKILSTPSAAEIQPAEYRNVLARYSIFSEAEYKRYLQKLKDEKTLLARLDDVPYTNSIPRVLGTLKTLNNAIQSDFQRLYFGMAKTIEDRDSLLSSYRFALTSRLRSENESGFILDSRDSTSIFIILHPAVTAAAGTQAIVFRGDDEEIGTIEILHEGRARLIHSSRPLQPFDKILLNTSGEAP